MKNGERLPHELVSHRTVFHEIAQAMLFVIPGLTFRHSGLDPASSSRHFDRAPASGEICLDKYILFGQFRKSRFIRSRGYASAWAVNSSNKACAIFIVFDD